MADRSVVSMINSDVQYTAVEGNNLAYRVVGSGQPLVFITGWPFHSYTYRHIVPYLAQEFRCILIDSPGLGLTEWSDNTDFTFPGQAKTFGRFLDTLALDGYCLIAHNTGATIARILAAEHANRVRKFIILNTEIPGERPPWFPLYAKLMGLPASPLMFRTLLRSNAFLKSPMGFGNCYADRSLIDELFLQQYVVPLINNGRRLEGAMRYLRIGLDFKLIDALPDVHARIKTPVHFIWGKADPTFPLAAARRMFKDFPLFSGITEIENGKLLAHEEFPEQVAKAALTFLQSA